MSFLALVVAVTTAARGLSSVGGMVILRQAQRIAEKAAEAGSAAAEEFAPMLQGFEPLHQLADRHVSLHPGKRHPGAGVDSGAEGEMSIGMPGDVQTLGIGKLSRISVRRPNPDVDIGCRAASRRRPASCPSPPGGCRACWSFRPEEIPRLRSRSARGGRASYAVRQDCGSKGRRRCR